LGCPELNINKQTVIMSNATDKPLLEALLDSWDHNNSILLNLLQIIPEGGLEGESGRG
jgi:hypothetical protein